MKKTVALILILATALTLVSCGGKSDIPEGMQLVLGGEKYGYYMYAPEEWTVSNIGEIASAHASSVDTSSISYVETALPEGTVKEYFEKSKAEFTFDISIVTDGEATTFGNAESAVMYVYDYEYSEHKFRTMQVFVEFEGRFGIFTYTSTRENMTLLEKTQYDYYLTKINDVMKNFKFVTKKGSPDKPVFTEKDADGYILSSDVSLCGIALYLPESFAPEYSSGIITARASDGSSVTVSRATSTGVNVKTYWETRMKELEKLFGEVTLIEEVKSMKIGNSKNAVSYEYTYVHNGITYHVYQVLAITTFNGYVFTYTAADENYGSHTEEIRKISEKISFK